MKIFTALLKRPHLESELVDGSFVQTDQHSPGAVGQDNRSIAKSHAGESTKIHLAVDSFAFPIDLKLLALRSTTAKPQRINSETAPV